MEPFEFKQCITILKSTGKKAKNLAEFLMAIKYVKSDKKRRRGCRDMIPILTEVEEMVDKINWRFQTKGWKPIVFLKAHHSHEEINRFYRTADICMVTSLHDGMNLVAKEFVTSNDNEDGVLILSQFTGASRELKDAVIINPYDIEEMADAIYLSLTMESSERTERMQRMRSLIKEHNIYRWAGNLITSLARLRISESPEQERV